MRERKRICVFCLEHIEATRHKVLPRIGVVVPEIEIEPARLMPGRFFMESYPTCVEAFFNRELHFCIHYMQGLITALQISWLISCLIEAMRNNF